MKDFWKKTREFFSNFLKKVRGILLGSFILIVTLPIAMLLDVMERIFSIKLRKKWIKKAIKR